MSGLVLWKAVWAAILHAVGSPLEALIRVTFEGGLVYGLCRSRRVIQALRWTREPLVTNSYIRRMWSTYGRTSTFLNLFLLLPLDILRAVVLSVPQGFYLAEQLEVSDSKEDARFCLTCGARQSDS